jgi:hypothetical protein
MEANTTTYLFKTTLNIEKDIEIDEPCIDPTKN